MGGGWITLGIMQTQPSLAGVGAGAELGNKRTQKQIKKTETVKELGWKRLKE